MLDHDARSVKTLLTAVAALAVLTSCAAEQANPTPNFPSTSTDAAIASAQPTTTTLPALPPPPPPPPAIAEATTTAALEPAQAPSEEAPAPQCDSNYTGACVPIASDVDCAGGSGNGPAYVRGPVRVVGSDHYKLDSDGDGIGCET